MSPFAVLTLANGLFLIFSITCAAVTPTVRPPIFSAKAEAVLCGVFEICTSNTARDKSFGILDRKCLFPSETDVLSVIWLNRERASMFAWIERMRVILDMLEKVLGTRKGLIAHVGMVTLTDNMSKNKRI